MKKLALMMVCVMFLTSIALAHMGPESDEKTGQRHKGMHQDMIKQLNLTEEQVEALHKNRTENLKKGIEVKSKIQLAIVDLQEELRKKELDKRKIDKIIDEIGKLQKEAVAIRVYSVIGLREILTEEQLEKARALAIFKIKGEGYGWEHKEGKKYQMKK